MVALLPSPATTAIASALINTTLPGNGTLPGTSPGIKNLTRPERQQRSLSPYTSTLYCKSGHYLQIWPDGTINGTNSNTAEYAKIKFVTLALALVSIQGFKSRHYLCMNATGDLYATRAWNRDCQFKEDILSNYFHTYTSNHYQTVRKSGRKKKWYVALDNNGLPLSGKSVSRKNFKAHWLTSNVRTSDATTPGIPYHVPRTTTLPPVVPVTRNKLETGTKKAKEHRKHRHNHNDRTRKKKRKKGRKNRKNRNRNKKNRNNKNQDSKDKNDKDSSLRTIHMDAGAVKSLESRNLRLETSKTISSTLSTLLQKISPTGHNINNKKDQVTHLSSQRQKEDKNNNKNNQRHKKQNGRRRKNRRKHRKRQSRRRKKDDNTDDKT